MNQTSEVDEDRYSSIAPLQPIDDMFRIEDNVIDIGDGDDDGDGVLQEKAQDWMLHQNVFAGKGAGELNLIILIPKTEARAQGGEVWFVS